MSLNNPKCVKLFWNYHYVKKKITQSIVKNLKCNTSWIINYYPILIKSWKIILVGRYTNICVVELNEYSKWYNIKS